MELILSLSIRSSGGGLEEALILLYLLVDEAYRIVTFDGRLRQRGPEPKLSEVLTMEIFGEQRHDDAAIYRYFDGHLLSGPRIRPSLRPAVRGADQAADPCVSGQRHHSPSRRLSDLSRLPAMPDLPGRGSYCATKKEHWPARPSGHHSGGHGGGRHGGQRRRTRRGSQPLRQGPADRRQGVHLWRAEGRGG